MPLKNFLVYIGLTVLALVEIPGHADTDVVSYRCPGDAPSDLYHVSINGTEAFVSKFFSVPYAHVACSGAVQVAIHASSPIRKASVSPKRRGIETKINGNDLLFSVECNHPQHLVVSIDDGPKLVLFLDPPEQNAPRIGQPNVVDASAWLKDPTGHDDEAAAFQAALAAVDGTGKTLYVPPGIYLCTKLPIAGRKNLGIYLAPGVLIRTSYKDKDATLLDITDSRKIVVSGRGVLDNQNIENKAFHKAGDQFGTGNIIHIANSSDVLIDGLVLRDSRTWTVYGSDCDRLTLRNCKIVNPAECNFVWTDGYDITGGDNLLLEDCFALTEDDTFAAGDYGGQRESTHFTIKGLVGYSLHANGVRLGFDSRPRLADFHFEDCDILHVRFYGICLNARANPRTVAAPEPLPKMGLVSFAHCGFELEPSCLAFLGAGVVQEWDNPQVWTGLHIDRLEFTDVAVSPIPNPSRIFGTPSDPIDEVVLDQVKVGDRPVLKAADLHLKIENVKKLTINGELQP